MTDVKQKSVASAELLQTADKLHSAAIHLLRRLRVRDRESGVGPAQLSALSVLVFGGPRSLGELADAEQVRPPTMSRIVSGLAAAGLVRREATEDGRRVRRYARRWLVERYFAWLQWKRRLVVRWEYYASNFLGFVELASITILLKRI